jgi:hydrogenase-4 component F
VTTLVLLLLIVPFVVAVAALRAPVRLTQALTVAAGVVAFATALALVPTAAQHDVTTLRYLRVDALSAVFLLATSFLYAVVAAYSIGYLRAEEKDEDFGAYARKFYLGLNLFAWAMLAAPLMSSLALLWIAIEVTTVISALLVAIEDTDGAAEAAWKYVLIASAGLGIGLLATIFAYYAGAQVLGQSYDLTFSSLIAAGARLPHTAVQLSFVLAVVGYGTKVGLFPVHTWLPDAHSEAPTPVSALLSGSLLAVSFYAILRFFQVAVATLGPRFPQTVLLVFGVASLALAALYLLDQQDLKRLLAYSSVEHMGILAIAVSVGAPLALAGALLHVLAHAAAKANAFMGAGVLVRKYGTKRISSLTGGLDLLPWSGPLFLAAVLALSAMPPFGIFRSEFQIVAGALGSSRHAAAGILVVLVTVAFLGLSMATNRVLFVPSSGTSSGTSGESVGPLVRGEPSIWMVGPMLIGLVVLLVLGVHPPDQLTDLFTRGVAELRGTP